MAQRYAGDFVNTVTSTLVTWGVELHDDLGSFIGDFEIESSNNSGVRIVREGSGGEELEAGIFPTRAEVQFFIQDVQKDFYVDDLINHPRSRFHMVIKRNGVFYWAGRFATHNIVRRDQSYPTTCLIVAHDGLASLKNLDYEEAQTTVDKPIWEIIEEIFAYMDTTSLYTSPFLAVVCDWVNDNFPDTTTNPLEYTAVRPSIFLGNDGDFRTCWDVLEDIVKSWEMVLTNAHGFFYLYQIKSIASPPYRRFYYDSAFSLLSVDNNVDYVENILTDYSTEKSPYGGGNAFSTLEGLHQAETVLRINNYNVAQDLEWSDGDEGWKAVTTFQVPVEDNLAVRLRVLFESETTLDGTFANVAEINIHRYVWRVFVRFTDQLGVEDTLVLDRRLYFDGSWGSDWWNPQFAHEPLIAKTYSASTYRVDESSEVWLWEEESPGEYLPVNSKFRQLDAITAIGFGAAETVYDVDMKVELHGVYEINTETDMAPHPDFTFEWWARDVEMIFGAGLDELSNLNRTIKSRSVATNPNEFELKVSHEIPYGDVPNNHKGLLVYDGTNWIYSTQEWRFRDEPALVSRRFAMMRSKAVMALRLKNKQRFEGTFIDAAAHMDKVYNYQSLNLLPLGG